MRKIKRLPQVSNSMRDRARELRKNATPAECRLWQRLRNKQLGARFHRQRVVDRYICDFVSLDGNLIVELDGSQHYLETGQVQDKVRDAYLRSLGFTVLRFSNHDVMDNIEAVLQVIYDNLPPLNPPLQQQGGRERVANL